MNAAKLHTLDFTPGRTATTTPILCLNKRDGAKALGVSTPTFAKVAKEFGIRRVKLLGMWRYRADDLARVVEQATEATS